MRHLIPVKEACQQLGGISRTMFYALVKEGELSLVKIGSRSFVQAEDLDDFVRRRRYECCASFSMTMMASLGLATIRM